MVRARRAKATDPGTTRGELALSGCRLHRFVQQQLAGRMHMPIADLFRPEATLYRRQITPDSDLPLSAKGKNGQRPQVGPSWRNVTISS